MAAKKITRAGLRRLIMTEVRQLREAEVAPEWEELVGACAGAAAEAFREANPYSDDDGMGEDRGGAQAWDQQVDAAAQALTDELFELIAPVVQDVQARLDQGEFFADDGGRSQAMAAGHPRQTTTILARITDESSCPSSVQAGCR